MLVYLQHFFHVCLMTLFNLAYVWVGSNGTEGQLSFSPMPPTEKKVVQTGECHPLTIHFTKKTGPDLLAKADIRIDLLAIPTSKERLPSAKFFQKANCTEPINAVFLKGADSDVRFYTQDLRSENYLVMAKVARSPLSGLLGRYITGFYGGDFPSGEIEVKPSALGYVFLAGGNAEPIPGDCLPIRIMFGDKYGNVLQDVSRTVTLSATRGNFFRDSTCTGTPITAGTTPGKGDRTYAYFKDSTAVQEPFRQELKVTDYLTKIEGKLAFNLVPGVATDLYASNVDFQELSIVKYTTRTVVIKNRGTIPPKTFVPLNGGASYRFSAYGLLDYFPYSYFSYFLSYWPVSINGSSAFLSNYTAADLNKCAQIVRGTDCKITVVFKPESVGKYATNLRFQYTDRNTQKVLSIDLAGEGVNPGTPTKGYGPDKSGTSITGFGSISVQSKAIAIDSKNYTVVAAEADRGPVLGKGIILARYNTNGILDTRFGSNLDGTTGPFGSQQSVVGVAILKDGSIVVGGSTRDGIDHRQKFSLTQFDVSGDQLGSPLVIDFRYGDAEASAMALDSNGDIILAGTLLDGLDSDYAVARIKTDAGNLRLDTSFDYDGMQTVNLLSFKKVKKGFTASPDKAYAVAVQTDHKILLAGVTTSKKLKQMVGIVRLNSDGTLDSAFDKDGIRAIHRDSKSDEARALAILKDGTIVVGVNSDKGRIVLTFLNPWNGKAFSHVKVDSGKATDDNITGLAVQPNGKILITGYTTTSSWAGVKTSLLIARLDSYWRKDRFFIGTGSIPGMVEMTFAGSPRNSGGAIASYMNPSYDMIFVAGSTTDSQGVSRMTLSRIHP